MRSLVIKDSAVIEIQQAFEYLESKETDLGARMLQKLSIYLEVIQSNPHVFAAEYRQVRSTRIHPFQFLIRYKIYNDYIIVIQFFHGKQNPKRKLSS